MRIIDADALIEFCAERWIPLNVDAVNMQPTIEPKKNECDHKHCPLQYNYVSDNCDIPECPWRTVGKHGHWIRIHPLQEDDTGAYMCSECKVGNWGIDPKSYFFCPNCGLPMIGGDE